MKVSSLVPLAIGTLFSQVGLAATAIVPTDYATIQAAVTAVQGTAGALVTVNSNATFTENITATQSVEIAAGVGLSPLIRPAAGSAISLEPNAATDQTFTLTGLRVQGCGGGVSSIINLSNKNTAGNVYLNLAGVDITNAGCGSSSTGLRSARALGPGTSTNYVTMTNSTIDIVTPAGGGFAIEMVDLPGRLTLTDSTLDITNGTGLAINGSGPAGPAGTHIELNVANTDFTVNTTVGTSANAMRLQNNVTSDIRGSRFTFANGSTNVGGIVIFGTLLANTHTITQNTFSRASLGSGSGVLLIPYGDATYGPQSGTATVTNNVMRNIDSGMTINPQYPGDSAFLVAMNNTVHNARHCLYLSALDGTNINGRFSNNLCTNISGSTGTVGGVPAVFGAIAATERAGANITMTFANNGFYNNANGDYSPMVAGIPNVAAVVTTDPIYVNPLAGDLRLGTGSPAIDAGVMEASVAVDHDGTGRPQAAAYDLGAFEGAFAVVIPPVKPIPTLGKPAIALLSLILAAMAIGVQRRNRNL